MELFKQLEAVRTNVFFEINIYKCICFIAVITLTLFLRKIFVKPVIKKLNTVVGKTGSHTGDLLVKRIELPVNALFTLAGIWISIEILSPKGDFKLFMGHVLRSVLAFMIFWAVFRSADVLVLILQKLAERADISLNSMMLSFMKSCLKAVVVILGIIAVMQEWGYNATGLLAGLGLGGLALALAVKDTLANFFGSMMIMLDKPFDVGDWIMTPHVEGTVEEVGFRSTRVRTFAQALVTIPNSMMTADPVTNWSRMGKRRVNFRLGISHRTRMADMKNCIGRIRAILENHPEVHQETILVHFERFSQNSLELFIYFFTNTISWQRFMEVQEDINFKILHILEDLNITIAYPSRMVYIERNEKSSEKL